MKKKQPTRTIRFVVRRECDEAMANKKGMLNKCNQDCKHCFCCIETYESGDREHHNKA